MADARIEEAVRKAIEEINKKDAAPPVPQKPKDELMEEIGLDMLKFKSIARPTLKERNEYIALMDSKLTLLTQMDGLTIKDRIIIRTGIRALNNLKQMPIK